MEKVNFGVQLFQQLTRETDAHKIASRIHCHYDYEEGKYFLLSNFIAIIIPIFACFQKPDPKKVRSVAVNLVYSHSYHPGKVLIRTRSYISKVSLIHNHYIQIEMKNNFLNIIYGQTRENSCLFLTLSWLLELHDID